MDPPRRGPAAADTRVGAPRALPRPEGAQAGRGAARHAGSRAARSPACSSPDAGFLVPDENVSWNLTAIPAAIRIVKREQIDVVVTTSPPSSVHLVGAAVKRATGIPWVADLRDSVVAHPHRSAERLAVRVKEQGEHAVAQADHPQRRRDRRRLRGDRRARCASARRAARSSTIANGSDFDDFARDRAPRVEPLPHHARRVVLRQARPAAVPHGA